MMIVDFHVHHYPELYLEALRAPGSGVKVQRRPQDSRLIVRSPGGVTLTVPYLIPDMPQRLNMMDELGIDLQVLSIPSPSADFLEAKKAAVLARNVNEALATFHRDRPDRFDAMAILPMRDPDLALEELERALQELDMRGTMILTHVNGRPLDDPMFESFWSRANELGLLVHVHPTTPSVAGLAADFALTIAIGFMCETTLCLGRLAVAGIFKRYPDIRWVFSHLGGTLPFILPRLDRFVKEFEYLPEPPTTYLKSTFYDTVSTHQPALRCASDTLGSSQLIFGTDYPHIHGGPKPFLVALDEALDLSERERSDLLGGRAQRLLDGKKPE